MGFPGQGSDAPMMSDAFMAFRLLMSYLDDISNSIDPTSGRVRVTVETPVVVSGNVTILSGTLTNLQQIGGTVANSFIFDEMDIVWNTGIRPQIV